MNDVTGTRDALDFAEPLLDFPFPAGRGASLCPEYARPLREQPLLPVVLAGGHRALLVTRHADVRKVLSDDRFSREAWSNGTLFARDSSTLALATSDPPGHTRRRRAVQSWFTAHRAQQDRPRIEAAAESLLDALVAQGPPADLIAGFTTPLPYRFVCEQLGLPLVDLEWLLPHASVMMSAGRYGTEEIAAAQQSMRGYFTEHLAERKAALQRGTPGSDLVSSLLIARGTASAENRISDDEIIVLALGLFIAGGETTANHLAICVHEILARPGLAGKLRDNPALIPSAVEELLRWIWFIGTGGHIHVVVEELELAGRTLPRGQIVIPLGDTANRDPEVFDDPDVLRIDRDPNPHLGFGHGRHMCLGAPHARAELQVGVEAVLRRLDGLALAVPEQELEWRDGMFIRGMWSLPVTWTEK